MCDSNQMLSALLRDHLRPYRRLVAALLSVQALSALASLTLPTINATIIDDGIARGDTGVIVRFGAVMLAVTAVQVLCAVGAVYLSARTSTGVGRDLRGTVFDHVTGFSDTETARFGAPSLLTRTTNDVRQIQVLVQLLCTVAVAAPIMGVGGIVMAIRQDAGLSWLLMVSVPALAVVNYALVGRMLPTFRRMQQLIDNLNRVLRDQLAGVRVVRALVREPAERDRFAVANRALSDASLTASNWQAVLLPATTLIINCSSVALIWFGGLRIDAGQMQVGSLVAFLSYFSQILMTVAMATMVLVVVPRAAVCAERITELRATTTAITGPAQPRYPPGGISGVVELARVGFCYPGADRPVLRDVSLSARPGSTTAVVGGTGSGKSTLIALICRLYDVTDGAVRVDGIDVRDYDIDRLWAAVGLVPQRGYLFSGTVADNLRYGTAPGQEVSETDLWAALRVAALDEFVAAHPDGLGMRVAQGGANLSGGQRQRLAIARAVIRRPAIYLFDDAFSALDTRTEARVRAALRTVAAEATVIVVAQRISSAVNADRVILLDDGQVVGVGTHDSLLADSPLYAEFADSQSVGVHR